MNENNVFKSTCCRGLDTIIANGIKELEKLGYSSGTIQNYRHTWNKFSLFMVDKSDEKDFLTDHVTQFLESCGIFSDKVETGLTFRQRHIRNVMHALTEFALHGCLQRRTHVSEKIKLADNMVEILSDYEKFCNQQSLSPLGTLRSRKRDIVRFLHYLETQGFSTVEKIRAPTLFQFIRSCAHLKPATLARMVSSIRSFLRYLCMRGFINSNLVEDMPTIRVRPDERIPSVWKSENVDMLLAAIDRNSPCGKRDYAILLLAVRLGMRVSDIRNLCFENLLWKRARIEIEQTKGGTPLALPMTEEIGNAIIDYLRHGRPESEHREIFLRANAPFNPFSYNNNLHYIITRYRQKAGISLPVQNRRGMHSLRHTVASRLLEANVALETISGIMGHLSLETTRIYTKIDIEALRSVAIDPEEVTHA